MPGPKDGAVTVGRRDRPPPPRRLRVPGGFRPPSSFSGGPPRPAAHGVGPAHLSAFGKNSRRASSRLIPFTLAYAFLSVSARTS